MQEIITKFFPTITMTLNLFACGVFLFYDNQQKAVYWFAAALITFSVTWMKHK